MNTDHPCYLRLWPTDFLKNFSQMEDVLWAAWPLAQPSSGAEWTAHSFRKPGPKYSGGTPIQRPREVARNHPGAKMQWPYSRVALQLGVTQTACALLPLNPHFPSSLPEEEASKVSKPWVRYTWGPEDTHCSPYSICS